MKRAIFFLTLLSLVAISSFASERADGGGVGVGNGRLVYRSPHGFSVQYENSLSLAVESDLKFRISNKGLVADGGKVSRISFEVSPGKVKSLAELEAYLAKEFPGINFQKTKLPGASGFYYEERSNSRLNGRYFLLTSSFDLVEVTLEAYPDGNGLAWVAPIVNTFAYDITPPTVAALSVDTHDWKAGGRYKVYVRATDDYAGISLRSFFADFSLIGADGKLQYGSFYAANAHREGPDLYSFELDINPYTPQGEYLLDLYGFDNAFNSFTLHGEPGKDHYSQTNGPDLPLLKVSVTNAGQADTTKPTLLGYRLDNKVWKTGTRQKIHLKLGDDLSGIDVSRLRILDLESNFRKNGHGFYSGGFKNPKDEGNGWYSFDVDVGKYLPSGEYLVVGIDLWDKAGNYDYFSTQLPYDGYYHGKKIPVIKVEVENTGTEDITGPDLFEIRLDSLLWPVGSKQRIHFRAKDDLSGIAVGRNTYGYLLPVTPVPGTMTIYTDQAIVDEGGGWYGTDVTVNPFMKGGEYYLNSFYFGDKAGNSNSFKCDLNRDDPNSAPYCTNENGPSLSPVKVQIVR